MLTSDLIKPRLQQTGRTLGVEMIDEQNPFWQQTASDLIALFQRHVREQFLKLKPTRLPGSDPQDYPLSGSNIAVRRESYLTPLDRSR